LSAGEYVIKTDSAKKLGYGALDYINKSGKIPGFAEGGTVFGRAAGSIKTAADFFKEKRLGIADWTHEPSDTTSGIDRGILGSIGMGAMAIPDIGLRLAKAPLEFLSMVENLSKLQVEGKLGETVKGIYSSIKDLNLDKMKGIGKGMLEDIGKDLLEGGTGVTAGTLEGLIPSGLALSGIKKGVGFSKVGKSLKNVISNEKGSIRLSGLAKKKVSTPEKVPNKIKRGDISLEHLKQHTIKSQSKETLQNRIDELVTKFQSKVIEYGGIPTEKVVKRAKIDDQLTIIAGEIHKAKKQLGVLNIPKFAEGGYITEEEQFKRKRERAAIIKRLKQRRLESLKTMPGFKEEYERMKVREKYATVYEPIDVRTLKEEHIPIDVRDAGYDSITQFRRFIKRREDYKNYKEPLEIKRGDSYMNESGWLQDFEKKYSTEKEKGMFRTITMGPDNKPIWGTGSYEELEIKRKKSRIDRMIDQTPEKYGIDPVIKKASVATTPPIGRVIGKGGIIDQKRLQEILLKMQAETTKEPKDIKTEKNKDRKWWDKLKFWEKDFSKKEGTDFDYKSVKKAADKIIEERELKQSRGFIGSLGYVTGAAGRLPSNIHDAVSGVIDWGVSGVNTLWGDTKTLAGRFGDWGEKQYDVYTTPENYIDAFKSGIKDPLYNELMLD
ncbi:MAG: hypothetical protein KAS07_06115, partial [Candidatus Pacebacteria bacterium]|nr:hypothetical protein [Candidatus Paceibacterota bacterium]